MNPPSPSAVYPRHLEPLLRESLLDTPAVLVNGPRQCGKTTLVRQFEPAMAYYTLDDPGLLAAVRQDPVGFVRQLDRAIIDEVQRAPQLLLALKLAIDQDRRPGRFLLTGSANLMALPQVADSLAGRMALHTLLPLSQAEIMLRPNDFLVRALEQNWLTRPQSAPDTQQGNDLIAQVLAGGYPEMLQRTSTLRRQAWARAYVTTLVERDIRDIAQLDQLRQVPQLVNVAAELSGQLLNSAQIGGHIGLNHKTVEKYLGLLEKLYLVQRLPAWSRNELKRLIKTPKLHFLDAGLQSTLTRLTPQLAHTQRTRFGATLETWVYAEMLKLLSITPESWFLSHFRDKDQVEVDFVLESSMREIIGIEVKASATVQNSDFKGLRRLKDLAGSPFVTGIVLYDGNHALSFGDGLWAIPLAFL